MLFPASALADASAFLDGDTAGLELFDGSAAFAEDDGIADTVTDGCEVTFPATGIDAAAAAGGDTLVDTAGVATGDTDTIETLVA